MRLLPLSLILLAVSAGSASAQPALPDPDGPGLYSVGHTSLVVVDPGRDTHSPFGGRPVFVSVFYPADISDISAETPGAVYPLDPFYRRWPDSHSNDWERFGVTPAVEGVRPSRNAPFPLVLASPGAGGRSFSQLEYMLRLASHGLVVAGTQHYHDGAYAWDPRDPIDAVMLNRPLDVAFMLDAMLARNSNPEDLLFNSIRPDLVAASGHSLGGYAALALAGGDDVVCGSTSDALADTCLPVTTTRPDPRIKAIVPLDASSQLLHFAELARVTIPSMGVGEEWGSEMQDIQARQHAAISSEPNYRVDIRNTVHNSFSLGCVASRVLYSFGLISETQLNSTLSTPQCTTKTPQLTTLRLAAKYAAAFLKTHLSAEIGYQHILTPGWALTRETAVEFFVTEKLDDGSVEDEWPGWFWYFQHQPGSARARAQHDPATVPVLTIERIE